MAALRSAKVVSSRRNNLTHAGGPCGTPRGRTVHAGVREEGYFFTRAPTLRCSSSSVISSISCSDAWKPGGGAIGQHRGGFWWGVSCRIEDADAQRGPMSRDDSSSTDASSRISTRLTGGIERPDSRRARPRADCRSRSRSSTDGNSRYPSFFEDSARPIFQHSLNISSGRQGRVIIFAFITAGERVRESPIVKPGAGEVVDRQARTPVQYIRLGSR